MIHPNEKTDQIAGKLITYLRDELNDSTIEYDSPLTQLQGGFETATYRFQPKGIQKERNKRLVLRLYPERYGPESAVWESSVQNALANEGYPVARAYFICTDKSILGGAFFIMDFLPGKLMASAPIETIPEMLGKTHAALHRIDPESVFKSLNEQGIDENKCRLNNRFDFLQNIAKELPWICDSVDWLMENRPSEPRRLAICHGDFHPLNILIQDGRVTGVLDWPGFLIADPALDIANTIFLITVPPKHLASSSVEPDFASVDWEKFSRLYLDAYRAQVPLDSTNVDYYRVRRSIHALIEGFRGHQVWQHPLIVKDLIEFIHKITEIRITMPD
jgi:aminoglycoside phosphotransferase (APT) family kinase protein